MPPKFSELKVLSDAERRKMLKQREVEKKQADSIRIEKTQKTKAFVIIAAFVVISIFGVITYYSTAKRNEEIQQKQARQVELKFPSGELFMYDPGSKLWEKPSKKTLEEGSGIRTGKSGNISLILSKNRQMKMFENSEIIFRKIEPNLDDIEFLNLSAIFSKGTANFEMGPAPCTFNLDTDILSVKMQNGFSALFKVQYGKKDKIETIRVAVKSGRVQVLNKKSQSVYDVESLNEIIIDKNYQVCGPQRFSASSEVF